MNFTNLIELIRPTHWIKNFFVFIVPILHFKVLNFNEKPETKSTWINGGFFILNYKVFDYIKNDSISFERQPMENLAKNNKLMAFKHEGFWKCMDNLGDKNLLDKMCTENKKIPWIN